MQYDNEIPDPDEFITQLLHRLEINTEHSSASMAEVEHLLQNDGLDDPELIDLTHLPFVTIDNPDSRDLDQALLIERHAERYRIRYALADASFYVKPHSALFQEALTRGSSYYTPTVAIPMLPVELSEGLISLNPNVSRRALVFDMELLENTQVCRCTILRARIKSQAKLNYGGVQSWLDSDAPDSQPFHRSLRLLAEIGETLIQASAERGVIGFDRSETAIHINGSPPRIEARVRQRYRTERYNEQLSLLCNMQGAEMMLALDGVSDVVQSVFRVHEAPLRKRLNALRSTLDKFAEQQSEPEKWRWKPGQSLASYVEQLPDGLADRRRAQAIQRQIMQAQRASVFQPEPGEHHALKAASYARFSSPMREIVGIFTHKELLEALGRGASQPNEIDSALRQQIIDSANAARQRQRQLDKSLGFAAISTIFTADLAMPEPPERTGTILGMRSDRIYVWLDELALEIKVYLDDLQRQYDSDYEISDVLASAADSHQPSWRLGQKVNTRVAGFDKSRKRFQFNLEPAMCDAGSEQ